MDSIQKYFKDLDRDKLDKLKKLEPLYQEWNQKINVISRKDMDSFYLHHVLHSMLIAKAISFKPGTKIMDFGTGGGFPAIPLAILFPDCDFFLVDSINKKLVVAENIANEIGLKNVQTSHSRVQDVNSRFDFVISRAVTRLDVAWNLIEKNLEDVDNNAQPNGLLYLKGGDIENELPVDKKVKIWPLKDFASETYFDEKILVLISR